jgi:ketosteroid isomerase-like protein
MFCAPGRNRTYDRQIRRLLLYPLSYGGRSTPFIEIDAGSRITVAPELSSRSNVQCDATSHGGPYASPIPRSDRCCFRPAPSGTRFFMAADSKDFELFLRQRQAAAGEYVSGNPEPLGRLVAQELPATFFSPRGDVTTGTHDVWARYERDASLFASGSENAFESLDSAAGGDIAYWVGFQRSEANMRGEDRPVAFDLRVTEIYRRENGHWKLVHRHADPVKQRPSP